MSAQLEEFATLIKLEKKCFALRVFGYFYVVTEVMSIQMQH